MLGMGQRISTMPSILNLRSPGPHSLHWTGPTRLGLPGLILARGEGAPPPLFTPDLEARDIWETRIYTVIV